MINKITKVIIANFLIFFAAGTFHSFGQENVPDIKDKKITLNMDNQPLGKIFEQLIVNYDVAIGFEESTLDQDHDDYEFETNLPHVQEKRFVSNDGNVQISIRSKRVFTPTKHWFTINVKEARLEEVLDIIVDQMKNYKWEINDGVVNIFPIRGRDKRYEELLQLNIKEFNLEDSRLKSKNKPIFLIRTKIFSLPEVTSFLDQANIHYNKLYREFLDNLKRTLPNEIEFSNLTLKELLNKITKIKRGGWILKKNDIFGSKEKEFIEINI